MKHLIYMLLICTLLLSSGCAVFNRNNTPALNFVEKNLIPKENPAKAISYPLVIPVGAVAATMDMFIFHPISVVSESWDDTTDILWKRMNWDTKYATTTASVLPRTVLTPVIFTGDFLFRSTFDIDSRHSHVAADTNRAEYDRKQEEKKNAERANEMQAVEALNKNNYSDAIMYAGKALASNSYLYNMAAVKASALLESGQLEQLATMPTHLRIFSNQDFVSRFTRHLGTTTPADTLHLLSFLEKHNIAQIYDPKSKSLAKDKQELLDAQNQLGAAIIKLLEHNDRAIRLRTIQAAGKRLNDLKELRAPLEKIAASADPVMAVAAREALPENRK